MKNSWAGKTLVLSFSFLVKYFSSGGPWEGYTAIFKSKGCLSAGSKRNRSFIGYMWPCQRIFTGQRRLPASFTQFTIKENTEMAVLLRAQHSLHQPVQNTAAKMVHLVSWNADVCILLWKCSKCTFVLTIRWWAPGKLCQSQKMYQDSMQSKMSPFKWEARSHCVWHGF